MSANLSACRRLRLKSSSDAILCRESSVFHAAPLSAILSAIV